MEVATDQLVRLPVDNFRIYLEKVRMNLENPMLRSEVLNPVREGCYDSAIAILTTIVYISEFVNNKDSVYQTMDPRLNPYLPYFVAKDVWYVQSKPFIGRTNEASIRPNENATLETFNRLMEFSKDNVVYLTLSLHGSDMATHHFGLYNGKICSSWGEDFNVYYIEKEISAEDLMFFMKFSGGGSSEDQVRFRNLIGKYLLDMESFEYPSLLQITNISDPTPDKETKTLIVDKILPIMGWIYELEDKRFYGNPACIPEYYKDINELVLKEWNTIVDLFLNRGVEITSVRPGPDEVMYRTERDALNPKEWASEPQRNYNERIEILTELLNLFGINEENDVDDGEEGFKNYKGIIEKMKDLYINGLDNNTHELFNIQKIKRLRSERPRALELYKKQELETIAQPEIQELKDNFFYQIYNRVVDSNSRGQIITCILYSSYEPTNLYNPEYNEKMWGEMFDIITDFTLPEYVTSISKEVPMITAYGQKMSQLTMSFHNEYESVLEIYGEDIEMIISKLNGAYRAMELPIPGEPVTGIERPLIITNTECKECSGSSCVLPRSSLPPPPLPPLPPHPSLSTSSSPRIAELKKRKSNEIQNKPVGMITRSMSKKMATSKTGGRTKRRTRRHRRRPRQTKKRPQRRSRIRKTHKKRV